jgi:hypothetical protein
MTALYRPRPMILDDLSKKVLFNGKWMSIDTILHNVKWSPFSIVIMAIEEYSDVLFTFMLSRLSPNDKNI